jgi:hypothetical protein
MPMYDWVCKACGRTTSTICSPDDRDVQPADVHDSCSMSPGGPDEPHEWIRELPKSSKVIRGKSWGGGKGNWLYLLAFLPYTLGSW